MRDTGSLTSNFYFPMVLEKFIHVKNSDLQFISWEPTKDLERLMPNVKTHVFNTKLKIKSERL